MAQMHRREERLPHALQGRWVGEGEGEGQGVQRGLGASGTVAEERMAQGQKNSV